MLATCVSRNPSSSDDDYPCLISTPASKPPPSQEATLPFANAYTTVAAIFLKSSPQHLWDNNQKKCAHRLQIIRNVVSNPPPPMHPDWEVYYETVAAVLHNSLQPLNNISQFCEIIQRHKDVIKHLESRNTYVKEKLIQLLDDLDNPSDPDAHSRAIDAQLALLDDFDRRIDASQNALLQFAGV